MTEDEVKSLACKDYLAAEAELEALRERNAPAEEIEAARTKEAARWAAVKHLMPDAMCR